MDKFTRYDRYPNPFASPAPYSIEECTECGLRTGLKGNIWQRFICLHCFERALDKTDLTALELQESYSGFIGTVYNGTNKSSI